MGETGGPTDEVERPPDVPPDATLVAVVPRRLTASSDPAQGEDVLARHPTLATAAKIGLDWAALSARARVDEMSAHFAGIEQERFYRIRRYQAMTGEKLVMACTTGIEAQLWTQQREARDHNTEHEMAHRAVTELQAYFLMAAGHDLANITGRVLALDPALRVHLLERLGTGFPVGGTGYNDYLSLNTGCAQAMRKVAKTSSYATLKLMPEAISRLVVDSQWTAMTDGRHGDFHRERTTSHGTVVLPERAWESAEGGSTLYIGGPETSAAAENLALERAGACMAALAVLTEQMKVLGAQVNAVLDEFCAVHAATAKGWLKRNVNPAE